MSQEQKARIDVDGTLWHVRRTTGGNLSINIAVARPSDNGERMFVSYFHTIISGEDADYIEQEFEYGLRCEVEGDIEMHVYKNGNATRTAANIRNYTMSIHFAHGVETFHSNREEYV